VISIHLRRTGAKKDPHYRVVVTDSRAARDGAFIEVLGHYHPRFEPAKVVLDVDKTKAWIEKGAQPSDTVKSLLRKVESGSVDIERPVAQSRHRDASKHAEIRASAPKPEPEPEAAAAPAEASDVAEVEASADETSKEAEAPAAEEAEEKAEEKEEDKE